MSPRLRRAAGREVPGAGGSQQWAVEEEEQDKGRRSRAQTGTWSDFARAIDHSRLGWASPTGTQGVGCDVQFDTTVRYSKAVNRLGIAGSFSTSPLLESGISSHVRLGRTIP